VAYVSFYRGKQLAFQTEPLIIKDGLNPKSKAIPIRMSVPLSKLLTGKYDCQVSVLNPTTQKRMFSRAPIMVLP